MTDRNQVILVGRIGGKLVERKAQNGSSYIFFPFSLENRDAADSTDNNYSQDLHIMVFKKPVIDYMRRVKAKSGNRVVVFGFMSAFKTEVNGKTIISNAINAIDVMIVKSRSDEEIIQSQKQ